MADVHDAILDEAPAYLLGELDAVARQAVDAHLAGCAACRAEYGRMREALDALSTGAPDIEPPAQLRTRILTAARAEADGRPARQATRPRQKPWAVAWLPAVAVAAALVLAVETAVTTRALHATQQANQALAAQNRTLRAQLAGQGALQLSVLQLAATKTAQGAPTAELAFAHHGGSGVVAVVAHGLPAPQGTQVYQLWYLPATGAPVSGGVLRYSNGTATLRVSVSGTLHFAGAAVSREPHAGDTQPVGPIVLAST